MAIGAGGFSARPPLGRRGVPALLRDARRRTTGPMTASWTRRSWTGPSCCSCIPGTLIHGRRDISGPVVLPWRLHRAWPGSDLIIDEGEGHGGTSMVEAWCTPTAGTRTPSSPADRRRPRSRSAVAVEVRRDQAADRVEVVAALLHQTAGRPSEPSRRPAAAYPSAVTCSGLSGSSAAASTPSETTSASRPRAYSVSAPHGLEPRARRRCPRAAGGCGWRPPPRRRRSRRRGRRSAGTSRRRGRRAASRSGRRGAPRRSPGCRCRGGRRGRRPRRCRARRRAAPRRRSRRC